MVGCLSAIQESNRHLCTNYLGKLPGPQAFKRYHQTNIIKLIKHQISYIYYNCIFFVPLELLMVHYPGFQTLTAIPVCQKQNKMIQKEKPNSFQYNLYNFKSEEINSFCTSEPFLWIVTYCELNVMVFC